MGARLRGGTYIRKLKKKCELDDRDIENQVVGGGWITLASTRKCDVGRYTDNMKDGIRPMWVLPCSALDEDW